MSELSINHEEIWLQGDMHGETTWCDEQVNHNDVRYVNADKSDARIAALEAELAPWLKMARQLDELRGEEATDFTISLLSDDLRFWVEIFRQGDSVERFWTQIVEAFGDTLPAAVDAAYRQVKGVGDE